MTTTATRAPRLADWALSHGRSAFSTSDLAGILGVPPAQVSERLSAPLARHEWCTPARGLWVPVPPEYRAWGAPPGIEIVEALTQHLAVPYYVGWLSAAQQQGVAQQSPQLLQIAVSRQVRDRQVGRTRFAFRLRADVDQVPVRLAETRSGSVRVSSPEATALDIARDVRFAAGIDNVATVLVEMDEADILDHAGLADLARHYPASAVRRLGWVLEVLGRSDHLDELRAVATAGPPTPSRLDPSRSLVGSVDDRWLVRVNSVVEADL